MAPRACSADEVANVMVVVFECISGIQDVRVVLWVCRAKTICLLDSLQEQIWNTENQVLKSYSNRVYSL